jgi:hypothetical protein
MTIDVFLLLVPLFGLLASLASSAVDWFRGRRMRRFHKAQAAARRLERKSGAINPRGKHR